jgi:hypothetical protein
MIHAARRGSRWDPSAGRSLADVRALAALLTGQAARPADADGWSRVAALASRECCGPLLWMRARTELATAAPASTVADLRAHAVTQAMRLRRRLERAADAVAGLTRAGVPLALWKGMATSASAHGDPFVRPSADVDLWVPAEARVTAQATLLAGGWELVEGRPPWEQAFERAFGAERERLELHTFLQGDLLSHLPSWPVQVREVDLDGVTLPATVGATLALSLAVHHARHRAAPLLWAADLRALLASVPREELADLARRTRTLGYLRHGERVAAALERLGAPLTEVDDTLAERDAAMLGFHAHGRDNGHPAWRDLTAAATLADRVAVSMAWLAPPRVREDGGLLRGSARRVARLLAKAPPPAPSDSVPAPRAPVHALAVDRDDLAVMLGAVVEQGGTMWLRARGRSMHPTIRDGALVRLRRVPDGTLATGSVVLARLGDGSWAMHRVVHETPAGVQLQGDATVAPDPLVPRVAVLATADATQSSDGTLRPIALRAPWTLVRLTRPARLAWWRLRARRRRATRDRSEAACPT